MSCKRLKPRTRTEQDFYLQWAERQATEDERLEFLRYDSHGGTKPVDNPILEGKTDYHLLATGWLNAYFRKPGYEGMWPGGMNLVAEEYKNLRLMSMLRREFGNEAVHRWVSALLHCAFGFKSNGV